jgi:hypothetical protein
MDLNQVQADSDWQRQMEQNLFWGNATIMNERPSVGAGLWEQMRVAMEPISAVDAMRPYQVAFNLAMAQGENVRGVSENLERGALNHDRVMAQMIALQAQERARAQFQAREQVLRAQYPLTPQERNYSIHVSEEGMRIFNEALMQDAMRHGIQFTSDPEGPGRPLYHPPAGYMMGVDPYQLATPDQSSRTESSNNEP